MKKNVNALGTSGIKKVRRGGYISTEGGTKRVKGSSKGLGIYSLSNETRNVRFTETARIYVANQIGLAVEKRVIKSKDKKIAARALFAVGIQSAKTFGKITVKSSDIRKGWDLVKMGLGNCPPCECIFSTVISRKTDFGNEVPYFNDLLIK